MKSITDEQAQELYNVLSLIMDSETDVVDKFVAEWANQILNEIDNASEDTDVRYAVTVSYGDVWRISDRVTGKWYSEIAYESQQVAQIECDRLNAEL